MSFDILRMNFAAGFFKSKIREFLFYSPTLLGYFSILFLQLATYNMPYVHYSGLKSSSINWTIK